MTSEWTAGLVAHGMSEPEASAKARLFERAAARLPAGGDAAGMQVVFVPGRIEVFGKHTDYAGGRSLLCAAERGFCLVARPRADRLVRVFDVVSDTSAHAVLEAGPAAPRAGWPLYVETVARRLARNFHEICRGADIAFGSDLPMAAGMSSSSALVTALLLALSAVNDLPATETYRANIASAEELAEYLGSIENGQDFRALKGDGGVGTFGGSEDHTAMLCCRAGALSQYRFCPVAHERQVPLPPACLFVIAVSGVVAEKTGAARETYNHAALLARRVLERWNDATGRRDGSLRAAIESVPDGADRVRAVIDEIDRVPFRFLAQGENRRAVEMRQALRARLDQFVEESFAIVPEAGDGLAAGQLDALSDLAARSQAGADAGLRNQVPETTFLAQAARENGALAASAFGAGFGGSVWALVSADHSSAFRANWSAAYAAAFPQNASSAQFFATHAGPPAVILSVL